MLKDDPEEAPEEGAGLYYPGVVLQAALDSLQSVLEEDYSQLFNEVQRAASSLIQNGDALAKALDASQQALNEIMKEYSGMLDEFTQQQALLEELRLDNTQLRAKQDETASALGRLTLEKEEVLGELTRFRDMAVFFKDHSQHIDHEKRVAAIQHQQALRLSEGDLEDEKKLSEQLQLMYSQLCSRFERTMADYSAVLQQNSRLRRQPRSAGEDPEIRVD